MAFPRDVLEKLLGRRAEEKVEEPAPSTPEPEINGSDLRPALEKVRKRAESRRAEAFADRNAKPWPVKHFPLDDWAEVPPITMDTPEGVFVRRPGGIGVNVNVTAHDLMSSSLRSVATHRVLDKIGEGELDHGVFTEHRRKLAEADEKLSQSILKSIADSIEKNGPISTAISTAGHTGGSLSFPAAAFGRVNVGAGVISSGAISSAGLSAAATVKIRNGLAAGIGIGIEPPEHPSDVLKDWIRNMQGNIKGIDPDLIAQISDTIAQYHQKIAEEHSVTEETKDPQTLAMEEVATHLTTEWGAHPPTFSLRAPTSLTILKEDNTYSRQAHIGGEEFVAVSAYVGKRGAIICVFTPVATERYTKMEMPFNDARENLRNFREHVTDIGATGKLAVIAQSKARIQQAQDLEKNATVYPDFGAW